MSIHELQYRFDRVDRRVTRWMAAHGVTLLRVSIGLVFFWFGALKLFPGFSPAEDLIRLSLDFLPLELFIPLLAAWEMAIGLGFITGRFMRFTILLMFLQMLGAASPIVLRPDLVFAQFPFVLTLEGQYIIKNIVVISGALVVGATVRGGGLSDQPRRTGDEAERAAA